MRILWLSGNAGLFVNKKQRTGGGYNGSGWIPSLQKLIISVPENKLALAYISHTFHSKEKQNDTIYYSVYDPPFNGFQKIKKYYGGYKRYNPKKYLNQIEDIIKDFNPDIIHLFGLENPLAAILGNTSIPVVVHLQGLLGPCNNAFFPVGFNKSSFIFPFTIKEWILRNGYIFAKNSIHVRGEIESSIFKKVRYVMGRTKWDFQVSQLMAPQTKYFHVDEVLREPFYEHAGKWKYHKAQELKIITTISNTIYKGLDTVLKTAKILKAHSNIPFKWQIIGISSKDPLVPFFERRLNITSKEVNIAYVGVLDASQLCNKLFDSHVYVHPSYIDNSPNSICEAQIVGIPVIGTYVGGIPSLITNEQTGFLVPANAPYELAYLLKKCYYEPELFSNIGKQGYLDAFQRHNKSKILKDLTDTYHNIINNQQNSYKIAQNSIKNF